MGVEILDTFFQGRETRERCDCYHSEISVAKRFSFILLSPSKDSFLGVGNDGLPFLDSVFTRLCVLLPTNADRSHSATSSSRTRSALAPSAGRRLAAADSAGPDCGGPLGPSRVPDASWRTSRRRSLCNVEINLRRAVKSEICLSQPELRTRSLG